MTRFLRNSAAALAMVLGATALAATTPAATAPSGAEDRVTRAYDVRALLVDPANASDAPTTVPHRRADQPGEKAAEELIGLVRQMMGPRNWTADDSIRHAGGQLVVRTTSINHQRIADLLRQMAEMAAVQVIVETRSLTLDAESARNVQKLLDRPHAGEFLSKEQVNELIRATQHGGQNTILTAPRITLFSGQDADVIVDTQTAYVSTLTMVRPVTGPTRYQPEVGIAHAGVRLRVRATVSADRRSVTLDLRPSLARLRDIKTVAYVNAATRESVQRPTVESVELSTSAVVPDGQTLLLAGPEVDAEAIEAWPVATTLRAPPATRPAGKAKLFLLIQPRVIPAPIGGE